MFSFISLFAVVALALVCAVVAAIIRRPCVRRNHDDDRRPMVKRQKLVHAINDERCVGCDACIEVCPTDVLELVANKSRVVRFDACIQCEQCALACPTGALVMHPRNSEPPPVTAPQLDPHYQAADGLYLIGEAAGKPLVKNASNLGRAVVEHMIKSGLGPQSATGDNVDVAIIGSGPGGLSAALTCVAHGLSFVVLEKDALVASTIASYPKGKHIMAEPYDVSCLGPLPVFDATKEELLARWQELLDARGVRVLTRHTVEKISKGEGGRFEVHATHGGAVLSWRAQRVVMAIGTRGTPRKLGVPGEHLPKVTPLLRDPDQHRGQRVLVVGGGDSAVEAAVALGTTARTVLLSYRGKALSRCKAKNRQALAAAVAEGKVRVAYRSTVVEIRPTSVIVDVEGQRSELANDHVFVCIGGDAPTKWLTGLGVQFAEQPHMLTRPASDALVESLVGPQAETRPAESAPAQVARSAAAALLLFAMGTAVSGCLADLVPLPAGTDQGTQPQALPGDGGVANFNPGIWQSVQTLGCAGCHSGGPPMTLIATPASTSDWDANYGEFSARAKNGSMSLVLTKNLTGSGLSHAGGAPFASTSDPTYVAWLAWISAGDPR